MRHSTAERVAATLSRQTRSCSAPRQATARRSRPTAPSDRREAVADQVERRARHVHHRIDAEDDRDALKRQAELASVPERITSDARGTAATPLLVSISVSIMSSCCDSGMSMPAACATNTDASAR